MPEETLVRTLAEAREFLENNPRVWPFVTAAVNARLGVGEAATAYGMDADSFHRVCTAACEKVDVLVSKQRRGAGPAV